MGGKTLAALCVFAPVRESFRSREIARFVVASARRFRGRFFVFGCSGFLCAISGARESGLRIRNNR
jgi:hypothetical protein